MLFICPLSNDPLEENGLISQNDLLPPNHSLGGLVKSKEIGAIDKDINRLAK